jgi:hypothetical protein
MTAVYCMTAAQHDSSLLYDSSTTWQQFTAWLAEQHDSSLLYD